MSQELTINGSIAYDDGVSQESLDIADLIADVGTDEFVHLIQSIGTSETAIFLGDLASIGWAFFKNLDTINYLEIATGTGGIAFAHLGPGETAGPFKFGSGVTAPFATADTGACKLEYLIVSA